MCRVTASIPRLTAATIATTAATPAAAGQYGATCSNTIYVIVNDDGSDTVSSGHPNIHIADIHSQVGASDSGADLIYVNG